jgi:hypothetical protein
MSTFDKLVGVTVSRTMFRLVRASSLEEHFASIFRWKSQPNKNLGTQARNLSWALFSYTLLPLN